jgi:chorismate--pyruvate lyase
MREDLLALRRHAEEEPDRHGTGTAAQDGGRRVVWRAGLAGFSTKPHAVPLTPAWRLFLLGDGSATRSLSLLTGADIRVDVIEMQDLADEADGPEELDQVAAPQLRRRVWLRADGWAVLGYAVSWWNARLARDYLTDPALPIGTNLDSLRCAPHRDIRSVFHARCPRVEAAFGYPGPFWGRDYLMRERGETLCLIREVFSPTLERSLGPGSGPSGAGHR